VIGTDTPSTGPEHVALFSSIGTIPVGYALSRFRRGRIYIKRTEETAAQFASNLFRGREGAKGDHR
jgi:hypothetical protein